MVLPAPKEDVLAALYQRKREWLAEIKAAEYRGDLKEAHTLQRRMREINSLIRERGGTLGG